MACNSLVSTPTLAHCFIDLLHSESKRLPAFNWDDFDALKVDPPHTPPPADFAGLTTFEELIEEDLDSIPEDRSGWDPDA